MANSDEKMEPSFNGSEEKTHDTIVDSTENCTLETEEGHVSNGQTMPTPEEEEAAVKKRYGGLMPKKPPLISKDHERAFFDSADWALGKQGAAPGHKPKSVVEALRPKLQPTPQPLRSRRLSYVGNGGEDGTVTPPEEAS